jgi:hypothetical protein
LQYQPWQVCQASQVHKIRETNIVDFHYITRDLELQNNSQKIQMIATLKGTLISLIFFEIFMQNGKVGEGDVFSKENVLIALVAYKFL